MDWKQYEEEIYQHYASEFASAKITRNSHIIGRYSNVERQIDVLIEDTIAGFHLKIVVDAKFRNKKIDVTDVEAFIGYCADIGASKGVLISMEGYTPAAVNRAFKDVSDVELDVLSFNELRQFQGFAAIPYSGKHGVFLLAPFGWVIDASRKSGFVAALYQRGYDLEKAGHAKEWMYINFWTKDVSASNLEKLILQQDQGLVADFPNAKITYRDGPQRSDGVTKIRCFVEKSYSAIEYTGFVEFKDFIFFCVLFTRPELANRNIRKLEYILRTVLPVGINQGKLA